MNTKVQFDMSLDELFEAEIDASQGIGEVRLGMTSGQLVERFVNSCDYYMAKDFISMTAYFPDTVVYTFGGYLDCFISLLTGTIKRIDVYGKFQGKYLNSIGIGSKVGDFRSIDKEVIIADDDMMKVSGTNLILTVSEDATSTLFPVEALDDLVIERISIRG